MRESLPCSSCSVQWKSFCWSVSCCCGCWNCCCSCSCTKLSPTWFNPFFLYLAHRLALCPKALSQQRCHRNAQNMEGLSTFPGADGLRNAFSGRFSYSTGGVTVRVKGLTIGGHTLTLFIHCDSHGSSAAAFFPVVFCSGHTL